MYFDNNVPKTVSSKAHAGWLTVVLLALFCTFLFEQRLGAALRATLGDKEEFSLATLHAGEHRPFLFKSHIERPNWFELSFDFRVPGPLTLDNLFQTADVNSGIRAEFSGDQLGLVIADETAPNKVKGFNFVERFEAGRWRRLKVSALNDGFLVVHLDGKNLWFSPRYRPHFALDRVIVGAGFSGDRPFSGEIRDIKLVVGRGVSASIAEALVVTLKIALVLVFLIGLRYSAWPKMTLFASPKASGFDPLLHARALACLMVVFGHGMLITFEPPHLNEAVSRDPFLMAFIASPWAGVWMFFTLSGYLMGKAFHFERYQLSNNGVMAFYRNRFLRIAPLYWAAIIVVLLADQSLRQLLRDPITLLRLFLGDNDGEMRLNPIGSLWSISTEFQFYLLVPIACALLVGVRRIGPLILIILGCALYGTLFRTIVLETMSWDFWQREVYKTLLGNLDLFLIGFLSSIAVGLFGEKRLRSGVVLGYAILASIYAASAKLSVLAMLQNNEAYRAFLYECYPSLVALATAVAIIAFELSSAKSGWVAYVGKRLEIFGLLTYGVYIWHEPVMHELRRLIPAVASSAQALGYCLAALVLTVLLSAFTRRTIEAPFEKRKKVPRLERQDGGVAGG